MNYLPWALLAMVTYTLVPLLIRVATSGAGAVPSNVAAMVSNGVLVVVAGGVVLATDQQLGPHLSSPKMSYVVAAGVCLAVGILAYYRALSLGPVSVVTPIFGLFLVTSAVVAAVLLGESMTARKSLGVGFALLAVYLVSVE